MFTRRYKMLRLLTSALLLFSFEVCMAQDPDDPSQTDPAVPVDGGISLLMAAGTAYGLYRARRSRRD